MSVDKYTKEVTLKPGVKEFLEMLEREGIRTGIATSNDRKLVEDFFKGKADHPSFSIRSVQAAK